MNQFADFPRIGKYYYTRRGEFKVLSIKNNMVTIEWQDNSDSLEIEIEEIRKSLILKQYSGDPDAYYPVEEDKRHFRKPIYKSYNDDDSGGDDDKKGEEE